MILFCDTSALLKLCIVEAGSEALKARWPKPRQSPCAALPGRKRMPHFHAGRNEPQITQWVLADRLGISVDKANYLLKALAGKGLIKLEELQHTQGAKDKLKKISHLLTPKGILERISLTRNSLSAWKKNTKRSRPKSPHLTGKTPGLAAGRSCK